MTFRLTTLYTPIDGEAFGRFDFELASDAFEVLPRFTLCLSMLTRAVVHAFCVNARLVRRVANFHEFAPLENAQLPWRFSLTGLTHRPKHRLDGPKAAFLALADGSCVKVEVGDLDTQSAARGPLRDAIVVPTKAQMVVTPWPNDVRIEEWRDDAPRLVAVPGSSAADVAALAASCDLRQRLFEGGVVANPELALAFHLDTAIALDAYRLSFATDRVTLAFAGDIGRDRGLPTPAQIAKGRFSEIGFQKWPCKVVVGWTLPRARNGITCLLRLLRPLPQPAP